MRFSSVIMAYLVIGTVMFGGGAISWDDSGMTNYVFQMQEEDHPTLNPNISNDMENTGGVISGMVTMMSGPLMVIWNLITGLISYINWPIFVLASNGAPPIATLLLGGSLTAAFYISFIQLWRS